jgi:hypothetical protein
VCAVWYVRAVRKVGAVLVAHVEDVMGYARTGACMLYFPLRMVCTRCTRYAA